LEEHAAKKNPNFQATERPTVFYFVRGLAEEIFKIGALRKTCYNSLCFDLSVYFACVLVTHGLALVCFLEIFGWFGSHRLVFLFLGLCVKIIA
jgi:hypothetical protein